MKIILISLALSISGCCTPSAYTPEGVEITDVVDQLKAALVSTQKDLDEFGMPDLKSVKITLGLVKKGESSANASFLVISGKTSSTTEETQKIAMTLEPPDKDEDEKVSGSSLRQSLVDAIVAAARTSQAADQAARIGEPKLEVTDVSAAVKFAVTNKGSAGIGFEVGGLELGGERTKATSDSHEIQITFSNDDDG